MMPKECRFRPWDPLSQDCRVNVDLDRTNITLEGAPPGAKMVNGTEKKRDSRPKSKILTTGVLRARVYPAEGISYIEF